MNITGNTVLISGGSSGIGLEMAEQFLARNNKVIITGRDQDKLENAERQLQGVTAIRNDVSSPNDVQALSQRVAQNFPELNILVNSAGIMQVINLLDNSCSATKLTAEIDINLKGVIFMNHAFLPLLQRNGNASIVNVSSGLAFVPFPVVPIYSSTKAAIHSYSLSLRTRLRPAGIRVFELAPPLTETGMLNGFAEQDIKGLPLMSVQDVVTVFMRGLARDRYEIRPGLANQLKFMSRYFPSFILAQMSKSINRFL